MNKENIINDEDSSSFNESLFFIEASNMILEETKSFIVDAILERKSINVENPSEVLSVIDMKLEKFIIDMNKLSSKFEATMNRLGSRTILMKSYTAKDFSTLKRSIRYNGTICNYTNIGVYNAYTSYQTEIQDIYCMFIRNLQKFAKIKNSSDFDKLYDSISKQKNINIGDYYRSRILGKKYDINDSNTEDEHNFYDELKKYYTGDGDDPIVKNFDFTPKAIYNTAKAFYSNLYLLCIKKECREITTAAKEMQEKLKKVKLDDYITLASNKQDWYNHSAKSAFDSIINDTLFRTQILCQVYLKYIAAKMEAAVNERQQSIKILKYVLRHMDDNNNTKEGGNK